MMSASMFHDPSRMSSLCNNFDSFNAPECSPLLRVLQEQNAFLVGSILASRYNDNLSASFQSSLQPLASQINTAFPLSNYSNRFALDRYASMSAMYASSLGETRLSSIYPQNFNFGPSGMNSSRDSVYR